jgi:subtilisin family serine protease
MHEKGYLGEGMNIAIFDVGFLKVDSMSAFDSLRINHQILGTRDFVHHDSFVYEGSEHGTYVLSCIAGNLPGQIIGTAPHADYWLFLTDDPFSETLQDELNWLSAAEFSDSIGVDIINSSLGYDVFDGNIGNHTYQDLDGHTTIVTKAADWAASKGIFVVNSAGNRGGPPRYKIVAPADADSILTVGSVDAAGNISFFSSRGPTADGRIKPNICAMGEQTVVASTVGGVTVENGTSFSSPLAAGASACLWQANPDANIMQLLYAIEQSGTQSASPDTIKGYGIPNFCTADSILKATLKVREYGDDKMLKIFPNPFNDGLFVDYFSEKMEVIYLELSDIEGRKIERKQYATQANTFNSFSFSDGLANISPGLYFFRIISANAVYCSKIVKQ